MTTTPVIGASPVTFISEATQPGLQYQVPLSALSFDANNSIDASADTWSAANAASDATLLKDILHDLINRGVIWPQPSS